MRTFTARCNQPDVFELTERLVRLNSEQNAQHGYHMLTLRYEYAAPRADNSATARQIDQTVQSLYEAAFAA